MPTMSPLHKGMATKVKFYLLLGLGMIVTIVILNTLFLFPKEANIILVVASLAVVGAILFFLFKEQPEQRRKLIACLILILISVGFWATYNQTFYLAHAFCRSKYVERSSRLYHRRRIPLEFFNPFFIIVFSPLLSWLWIRLDEKGMDFSTPTKIQPWCSILHGLSPDFLVLSGGVYFFSNGGIASPWWLIASYLFQTIGELLLSPIGLAMVTRLAPRHLVGMMMGVWFPHSSSGLCHRQWSLPLSVMLPKKISLSLLPLDIYAHAFFVYGLISVALCIVSFALVPYLKRMIFGSSSGPIVTPKI